MIPDLIQQFELNERFFYRVSLLDFTIADEQYNSTQNYEQIEQYTIARLTNKKTMAQNEGN